MGRFFLVAAAIVVMVGRVSAADTQEYRSTPLAKAFGTLPAMSGLHMSPDGTKISFLANLVDGQTVEAVLDLSTGKVAGVTKSEFGKFSINDCTWANNERLLCSTYGVSMVDYVLTPYTRLFAINTDGSKVVTLTNRSQGGVQFASSVVDLLSDEPDYVLISQFEPDRVRLQRVNIYTNKSKTVDFGSERVADWMTDGHGTPRLRLLKSEVEHKWQYVLPESHYWKTLYRHPVGTNDENDDKQYMSPAGFGADPNILLYYKPKDGRAALWEHDLRQRGDSQDKLIFARPDVDIDGLATIGKYDRAYAIGYTTDAAHMKVFDNAIDHILDAVEAIMPGKEVTVYNESWDRRYYLVKISSDDDPGTIYRLDIVKHQLGKIAPVFPDLEGKKLAKMKPVSYTARDGVKIPAYLTVPPGVKAKNLPLVVLPHGGPSSRDEWGFDPLVQYIVANGYAVLQSNYRGSGGYGDDWEGLGGFRAWRQAVNDLTDGAKALIDDGTVDENRICVLGWSYGGYAALMSAVESQGLYKCVTSIAGVTDPGTQLREDKKYEGYKAVRKFMGAGDKDVTETGSPLNRADELNVPVLMFHGTKDVNVSVKNSEKLADALRDKGKPVEYVEYEDAEHDIWRSSYRIDMFARIGAFLDAYIGASGASAAAVATTR